MPTHHRSIGGADLRELLEVFLAAGHVPGEAHDVLGPPARLLEHPHHVLQRHAHLRRETLGGILLASQPICPAMNTCVPRAAMPLVYPFGRAHSAG